MNVEKGGGDVEVRRALIHRQVIHIFPGILREVDDTNGMQRHSFIGGMALCNRPQMGKPHAGGTVHSQMHVSVRVSLGLFHALAEGKAL